MTLLSININLIKIFMKCYPNIQILVMDLGYGEKIGLKSLIG